MLKTLCSRSVALADLCTLVPNWVLAQGEGGFRVDVVNARSVTIDVNNIPILAQNLQANQLLHHQGAIDQEQ